MLSMSSGLYSYLMNKLEPKIMIKISHIKIGAVRKIDHFLNNLHSYIHIFLIALLMRVTENDATILAEKGASQNDI